MKLSKLSLAVASVLGAGISANAYAIELYVDTETQQLFAQPGPGRVKLGSFEKVEDKTVAQMRDHEEKQTQQKIINEIIDDKIARHDQAVQATPGFANVTMDKRGLSAVSADKNFAMNIGGRLHLDATASNNDDYLKDGVHVENNDGTEVRRARIRLAGTFFKDWNFVGDYDFADNNVAIKDLFLGYKLPEKWGSLQVGQQKQSFSHEVWASSNDMMFTERSSMSALTFPVIDRAIGLRYDNGGVINGMGWSTAVGAFGDTITANSNKSDADEGWGVAARGTFNPYLRKDKVIHLGLAGAYRQPNDHGDIMDKTDKGLEFSYETTHMSNLKLVDAGLGNLDHVALMGAEAAGMYGPFSVEGEYTRAWVQRNEDNGDPALSDLTFDGWYVQAGYTLTGESRTYQSKDGRFVRLKPHQNFSLNNGGWGAWEVAARYGAVDLNDQDVLGGSQSDVTVALNWYVNENVRFMADWTRVLSVSDSEITRTNGDQPEDLDYFTLRSQWAF
jgi:phosphate-selective porin OprO/OprP